MAASSLVVFYVVGGLLRFILLICPSKLSWLLEGVTVSTPINSWKRVTEGIHLYQKGLSPYSGNICHETPLFVATFDYITSAWAQLIPFIFVTCELVTALTLSLIAKHFTVQQLTKEKNEVKQYAVDSAKLLLKANAVNYIPYYVALLYLFHPYGVISCGAQTTTVFSNLILSTAIYFTVKGYGTVTCALLALATYQDFYPAVLFLPCLLYSADIKRQQKKMKADRVDFLAITVMAVTFVLTLSVLLLSSSVFMGGWNFIWPVYGCILNVDDLTPNIGLFWYLFTEMFDHFHLFFIYTFQINAFIYALPLTIRFRRDLMLVIFSLMGLMCIFKSYPCVGDIAVYTSLLPMWAHLYPFMRQTFLIGCFFLTCSVLGPFLFNLWIFNGSANANFFFGITLGFNVAQIFLLTDVLFAHLKREYHLVHGTAPRKDGQPVKLALE